MKEGLLQVSDGAGTPQMMKVILTDDLVIMQREELICVTPGEDPTLDNSRLNKERQVINLEKNVCCFFSI